MRIDQLPVASAIENTDTLPFSDGGITKQISVGNLTNSIRDNVYGAPLTASTSSDMTDTSRIYVYTGTTGGGFTNGHWYYYNGSAWTDGGTYNSAAVQTDTTLTLAGVPADAKATGELKTVVDDKLAEFDVAVETFYPTASGNGALVTIEGTVDAPPAELVIYGMSLQEGATPTPSAPVAIVTAGSGGAITMVSTGADMDEDPDKLTSAIPTPNGLPGIPVASGGNYIDTGETRWICDTIDLEAGTWTKRCSVVTLDGSENWVASTLVAGRYYLASTYTPDAVPYASHLCTHAVANPGSSTSDTGKSFFASGANFDINTEYASVEAFKAALATNNMVLVYELAAPVVNQLTVAQIAALRALRGRKGLTNLYSADPAGPEFRAEMYIDIPTYIQSVIRKPLSLYNLNITPGMWNNIHPDFDPETEEYAVTLHKGNAATVNAVVIGTTVTVAFSTIGGARTYFTMSTSSSAVGDRKTYSCKVNPYDVGVGGGLVITVTKGNLSRRYYLSITSVE